MTSKKALEGWETTLANTETTPQAIWPIAKSLTNRDGPTAIYGLLGLKYHSLDKSTPLLTVWKASLHRISCVTKIMNCGLEARVQALLQTADDSSERIS
jgi:hypothetical protein